MAPDPHAQRMEEEIAEIENRSGTRTLFIVVGGLAALLLVGIVAVGARERLRLLEESRRPQAQVVDIGSYVGTAGNTAVFASGDELSYVDGVGDASIESSTTFARPLSYDEAGNPLPLAEGVHHWSLASTDSLPYLIEPVENPLIGFSVQDYRQLPLGSLSRGDYGSGGPNDWRPLEEEGANVTVTGQARRADGAYYLVADPARVRLQGIEGLSPIDSLEIRWATESGAPLAAFGRISSTPRAGDAALFVMTLTAVQPPSSAGASPAEEPASP